MKIKTELIKGYIADMVCDSILDFEIGEDKITDTRAIKVLGEIQAVMYGDDKFSDFEMVEQIVSIFNKYNLDCGGCHDF